VAAEGGTGVDELARCASSFKRRIDLVDEASMASKARRRRVDPHAAPQRGESGAIFFELALVLPLLMALVLGIFTGGMAYTNKVSVVDAVREGARYGASLPLGAGATAVSTWEASVRSRVVNALGGDSATVDVCVKFALPTGGADCGLADPPGASNEPAVHLVKVSASRPATLEFFLFRTNTVLHGSLVARFERDTG
jgi:hypothetical protein